MKKILCFGDSNTYGFDPMTGQRFNENTRWTSLLQKELSGKYEIIEAGCNNRTCFSDNPQGEFQTGYKAILSALNDDFEWVIIQIGINDLQRFFNPSYDDFKRGLENFLQIIKNKSPKSKIILIRPQTLDETILKGSFSYQFDKNSIETSKQTGEIYNLAAKNFNCTLFDLNKIVKTSTDGLHYDENSHKIISQKLANIIK